jgi:hypothetical protein
VIAIEQAGRNPGATVVYESAPGVTEYGKIKRANDRYVFVEFDGGTKGCRPDDLRWSSMQQKPLVP